MAKTHSSSETPLRLRAVAQEDVAFLSSCLQDAIAPIVDMTYEAADRRFVMVVNRFKWEAGAVDPAGDDAFGTDEDDELPEGASAYWRTNCGLRIHGVSAVRHRGIDLNDRGAILNLLAVQAEPSTIMLDFSGGACLALTVERLDILLEDLGEPWLTFRQPDHAETDSPSEEPAQADAEQ
ncbi:MAG: DUF2948 family protein [Pseudomonadota bacterium]